MKRFFHNLSYFFLFVALIEACEIGFRLDDIQEFWITEAQQAVVDRFLSRKIPLSIGVITDSINLGDASHRTYLQRVTADAKAVEVCCHGWHHVDFSTLTPADQNVGLANCVNILKSYLPGIPPVRTFIPPYNAYNSQTIAALAGNNYNVFTNIDSCPVLGNTQQLVSFPTQAYTSYAGGQIGFNDGCPSAYTKAQIQAQINRCGGFSVVMLHPQEFARDSAGGLNSTMLAELDTLLDWVLTSGCTLKLLRDMAPQPSPAPATTLPSTATPPPPPPPSSTPTTPTATQVTRPAAPTTASTIPLNTEPSAPSSTTRVPGSASPGATFRATTVPPTTPPASAVKTVGGRLPTRELAIMASSAVSDTPPSMRTAVAIVFAAALGYFC